MGKSQKRGYFDYVPYFLVNGDWQLIPLYYMADAITECAKAGVKAGNFLIEDIEISEDSLRKTGLIELIKKLSKTTN